MADYNVIREQEVKSNYPDLYKKILQNFAKGLLHEGKFQFNESLYHYSLAIKLAKDKNWFYTNAYMRTAICNYKINRPYKALDFFHKCFVKEKNRFDNVKDIYIKAWLNVFKDIHKSLDAANDLDKNIKGSKLDDCLKKIEFFKKNILHFEFHGITDKNAVDKKEKLKKRISKAINNYKNLFIEKAGFLFMLSVFFDGNPDQSNIENPEKIQQIFDYISESKETCEKAQKLAKFTKSDIELYKKILDKFKEVSEKINSIKAKEIILKIKQLLEKSDNIPIKGYKNNILALNYLKEAKALYKDLADIYPEAKKGLDLKQSILDKIFARTVPNYAVVSDLCGFIKISIDKYMKVFEANLSKAHYNKLFKNLYKCIASDNNIANFENWSKICYAMRMFKLSNMISECVSKNSGLFYYMYGEISMSPISSELDRKIQGLFKDIDLDLDAKNISSNLTSNRKNKIV